MLLDNAVNRGQSHSGSLAHFLGGKKRFKDFAAHGLAHPAAFIGDTQPHKSPDHGIRLPLLVFRINHHQLGGDGKRTAARHGIARVHGEIDDNLL